MMSCVSNLTTKQSILYNDIIMDFELNERSKVKPQGYLRFGQAFYIFCVDRGIIEETCDYFPDIFYYEDNKKSQEAIIKMLCDFVTKNA